MVLLHVLGVEMAEEFLSLFHAYATIVVDVHQNKHVLRNHLLTGSQEVHQRFLKQSTNSALLLELYFYIHVHVGE